VKRLYLLGRGIQHSMSPPMWNGVFQRLRVDARYGLLDVDADGLPGALERLHEPDVLGFNVTMPYKAWAADQATDRSPDVEWAGVCNWIGAKDGRIAAANTDVAGARALLAAIPPPESVLLLGAGGTAAALLVALEGRANLVLVANRTLDRGAALAKRASAWLPDVRTIDWEERVREAARAALIVNTTPIGMHDDESPLDDARPRDDARVYDVVYRSRPTRLQRQARDWGLPLTDGLAHLEAQAVALIPHFGLDWKDAGLVRESLRRAAGQQPHRWRVPGDLES
jgi:shikimate dehydrogenase